MVLCVQTILSLLILSVNFYVVRICHLASFKLISFNVLLHFAVVNLTLIDLPGLTKVAVGMSLFILTAFSNIFYDDKYQAFSF